MHLLGTLGVDMGLLVAQVVNFLVLLWILNKLVYKPVIKRIESDEAALTEVKEAQARLKAESDRIEELNRQHATKSKNQTRMIIAEAEEMATTIRNQAREEAETEKRAVIAQIKQRLAELSCHE